MKFNISNKIIIAIQAEDKILNNKPIKNIPVLYNINEIINPINKQTNPKAILKAIHAKNIFTKIINILNNMTINISL